MKLPRLSRVLCRMQYQHPNLMPTTNVIKGEISSPGFYNLYLWSRPYVICLAGDLNQDYLFDCCLRFQWWFACEKTIAVYMSLKYPLTAAASHYSVSFSLQRRQRPQYRSNIEALTFCAKKISANGFWRCAGDSHSNTSTKVCCLSQTFWFVQRVAFTTRFREMQTNLICVPERKQSQTSRTL